MCRRSPGEKMRQQEEAYRHSSNATFSCENTRAGDTGDRSTGGFRLVMLVASALVFILLLALIEFEIVSSVLGPPPDGGVGSQAGATSNARYQHSGNDRSPAAFDDDDRIRPVISDSTTNGNGRGLQENATTGGGSDGGGTGRLRGSCDKSDAGIDEQTISITTNGMGVYEPIMGQARRQPRPIVVAGPSGVGKGTLINKLLDYYTPESERHGDEATKGGDYFAFSVSHTTRGPRPGEVDGVHYHFSTREVVQKGIDNGDFIEHAEVHSNLYGTSFDSVHSVAQSGRICILDIDIQGVKGVKASALDPHYIFVAPPSMELLEKRLRDRGTETEEAVKIRTANAAREVEYGRTPGNFDAIVVNDDLEEAFQRLHTLLRDWYPHLPQSVQ